MPRRLKLVPHLSVAELAARANEATDPITQAHWDLLYWLAWAAQNGTSLFSSADAQGPWRRVTICGVPAAVLSGIVGNVITDVTETNPALAFDRDKARGFRLDIPAGTAVRFEPGQTREVRLVALAGGRAVYGFRQAVMGRL